MRALLYFIVLCLCANAFPINYQREKRSSEFKDKCKENGKQKSNKTEISRTKCEFGKHFVGSNLFDGYRKTCFSFDDINLLIARRDFEMMIPRELPQDLPDDKAVADIMRYFYYGLWLLGRIDDCKIRRTMEKAFYDTLGGFLAYYLVPVVKYSYYASKVELKTVRNVILLYQKARLFLNTNGNGWRRPIKNPTAELTNVCIEPLKFEEDDDNACDPDKRFCTDLDLSTATSGTEIVDDQMVVALPKLELEDPDGFLGNVWLPFSRKRTYNLRSCKSAFIFVRFYRSVSSCYAMKGLEQKTFNHKFRQWIVENLKVHLDDEIFYPGLGGILNVYENLRAGCGKLKKNVDYDSLVADANPQHRKRAINMEKLNYLTDLADNMLNDNGIRTKKDDDTSSIDILAKEFVMPDLPDCSTSTERDCEVTTVVKLTTTKKNTLEDINIYEICSFNVTTFPPIEKELPTFIPLPLPVPLPQPQPQPYPLTTTKPCEHEECCQTEDEESKRYWFICCTCFIILFLLFWLCCLCTYCCIRHKENIRTYVKEKYDALFRKDGDRAKRTDSARSVGKSGSKTGETDKKHGKADKKGDKKADKKGDKKGDKKDDKTDKKAEKDDKKKGKRDKKSEKSPERDQKADKSGKSGKDDKRTGRSPSRDKKADKSGKSDKNAGKSDKDEEKSEKRSARSRSPKRDRKADKLDKKAEKIAKDAEKGINKTAKELGKGVDKSAKEAEKAAKKAAKEVEKAAKEAEKAAKKAEKDAKKQAKSDIARSEGGILTNPTRTHQKRGGRLHSRSSPEAPYIYY